jgi:hypothetical protein
MDKALRLMLFGPAQGSLFKALLAPARPGRPVPAPNHQGGEPGDGDESWGEVGDPGFDEAAVTALLASTFTGLGH